MTSILIVDDTESWRELLAQELEDVGYQVETAENAETAMQITRDRNGAFDYVLMDQVLLGDGMDGLQATKAFRDGFPHIRTIVMTIYGDGESSRAALEAGAYRYVFRSANIEESVVEIRGLIESAEALGEAERKLVDSFWMQHVFRDASMAIAVVDRTYRVLFENAAQQGIAGHRSQPGGICWVQWHGALQQKGPCQWCPIEPVFEGRNPEIKIVPLVKQGRLRYWQTGASPVRDDSGNVIAALKWGIEITEQEQARRAALEAPNVQARLEAAVAQIRMWGYARARLYELRQQESDLSGDTLVGLVEAGLSQPGISTVQWRIKEDWFSRQTLARLSPTIYRRSEHVEIPLEPALANDAIEEWLEVPLRTAEGYVIGKITVDNRLTPEQERPDRPYNPCPLTEEHFEDLCIVAGYAATAIWEERRLEQIIRERDLQRQLRELDAQIANVLELTPLLESIVERAVRLLSGDGGSLQLCDHVKRQVKVEVAHGLDDLQGMVFAFGEGLSGTIVQTEKHLVISDYYAWPYHAPQLDAEPFSSRLGALVGVPIRGEDKNVVGVLTVFAAPGGRRFREHDAILLESFADRAAIAIRNARLYQEKSALYDASKAITSSERPELVLERIWRATQRLIPAESALLLLWDGETGELSVGGSFGYDKAFLQEQGFFFRAREGYPGWIAATRHPLVVSDVTLRPDFPPKYPKMGPDKKLASYAGVPLIVRDKLIGVFALTSSVPGMLQEDHLRLLEALAEQIAIAVEQTRLFEETRKSAETSARLAGKLERRNRQLSAIGQVTAAMRSEDDPETVLRLALTGATADAGIGIGRAIYFEVDADRKTLQNALAIGALSEPEAQRNWLESKAYRSLAEYLDAARTWPRGPRGELDKLVHAMKAPIEETMGLLAQCALEGQAFLVADPGSQPYACEPPLARLKLGPHALVPLIAKDRPIGVLIVDNKFLPHSITEDDLNMIETLAAQAAVAIENARLIKTQRETFGDIAHQLFSPVQTIQGFIRLLADRRVNQIDTVQEYHQLIAEATEYLKGMADNLLTLRRIDTGRFEIQPEPTSVNEMVNSAKDLYRYAAEAKQIDITTDFHHAQRAEIIHVDKVKMIGAIQNLVENAIKYSPENTRVTISTSDSGTALLIAVQDQGHGIPPEERTHMFERHWRGQISKTKAVDGTGIGLSIARHTVEQHGGRIHFESELGKGSVFTIELPLP